MISEFISFAQDFFQKMNLHSAVVPLDTPDEAMSDLDLGLRKTLTGSTVSPVPFFLDTLRENALLSEDTHQILFFTDTYRCQYLAFLLPGEAAVGAAGERSGAAFLFVAGPWLTQRQSVSSIQDLCETLSIPLSQVSFLSAWYSTIPLFEEDLIIEQFMESLGDVIFGRGQFVLRRKSQVRAENSTYRSSGSDPNQNTLHLLERRYDLEEQMLDAIGRGDEEGALHAFGDKVFSALEDRAQTPLRSRKNGMFTLNTLCRKGAQRGSVHPVDLDDLSRRFAVKIESVRTEEEARQLSREMIRRYSRLVQTRTMAEYSPVIGKAITLIRQNLTDEDLSLAKLSDALSVNKSYLATLFKKETGTTVVSFINSSRIDHAIFLLNTTALSIQEIGAQSGIPDPNWFARVFAKEKGMTPSAYRKMIHKETPSKH